MTGVSIGSVDKDDVGVDDVVGVWSGALHPDISASRTRQGAVVKQKDFNIGILEAAAQVILLKINYLQMLL